MMMMGILMMLYRQLDEWDGYTPELEPNSTVQPPPLPQADARVIEVPITTVQPPPLPQAGAGVIEVPTTTVQPLPLPLAVVGVIKEPTTIVEPSRRAGSRQPVQDHSGKPCGCGCGKILEYKQYKTCPGCAYNKIRMPCWEMGIIVLHATNLLSAITIYQQYKTVVV